MSRWWFWSIYILHKIEMGVSWPSLHTHTILIEASWAFPILGADPRPLIAGTLNATGQFRGSHSDVFRRCGQTTASAPHCYHEPFRLSQMTTHDLSRAGSYGLKRKYKDRDKMLFQEVGTQLSDCMVYWSTIEYKQLPPRKPEVLASKAQDQVSNRHKPDQLQSNLDTATLSDYESL
jgi:hypothetical protein